MKLILTTQEAEHILSKLSDDDSPSALVEYISSGILLEKDTQTEFPTMQQLYDAGKEGYEIFVHPERKFYRLVHRDFTLDSQYEVYDVTFEPFYLNENVDTGFDLFKGMMRWFDKVNKYNP